MASGNYVSGSRIINKLTVAILVPPSWLDNQRQHSPREAAVTPGSLQRPTKDQGLYVLGPDRFREG
jgi:hypothetical protein